MAAITRANIAKQLLPGLNAVFGVEYGSVDDQHLPLFEIENSERAFEEEVLFTGFGTAPTVYARLAGLEKAGWIQTRPHPEDGRSKLVELSPHAVRTFRKMSAKAAKLL